MRFGILGPIEVRRAGQPVDVGGPKQQALLALLLLRPGRPVPTDWLVEALWDGRPPAGASTTLRSYIAGLRRALEPDRSHRGPAEVLPRRDGGYELRVAPESIDAVRFDALVDQARAALVGGDPDLAEHGFTESLRLWRGSPLAPVADFGVARAEIARLTELRLAAEEGRFAAAVAAGRHLAVLPGLQRFVADHPLREAARAGLMLALHRAGRQTEALASFADARRLLADEHGLDPGEHLLTAHRDVLGPARESASPDITALDLPTPAGSALIGREVESARLAEFLAGVRSGHGQAAVIVGEPGIGKTSLATALAELARANSVPVVWGHCPDVGQAPPFWLWSQVSRSLAQLTPDGAPGRDVALAAAAPDDGSTDPDLDPAARFRLYDAATQLVAAAAQRRSLLIVLDDLHAADPDSLLLLRYLATTLAGTRAGIVITSRPYRHNPAVVATVAEFARGSGFVQLELAGLAADAVSALVRRERRQPSTEGYVAAVLARTGGNPFFITELLRHERQASSGELPPSVLDTVRLRLDSLGPAARRCLDLLCVAGHELEILVMAEVLELPPVELAELLAEARAGQLASAAGAGLVRFRHPLFAEVAYADLAPLRRAALHAELAAAYERLGRAPAEIAYHYGQATGLGHGDDHLRWSLRAADSATRRLAFEDAIAQLDRAAAYLAGRGEAGTGGLPGAPAAELAIHLRRAALLQVTVGIGSEAVNRACVRARELLNQIESDVGDPDTDVGPALWTLAELAANRAEYDISAELSDRIQRRPDSRHHLVPAAGWYLRGAVEYFTGRLEQAEESLDAAVARLRELDLARLGTQVGRHPALAAYNFRALVRSLRGRGEQARDDLAAAAAMANRLDDPYARADAALYAGWMALQEGDEVAARVAGERCRAIGAQHRMPHFVATGEFFQEWSRLRAGDRSRAGALQSAFDGVYRPGLRATRTVTLAAMADAHLRAGDEAGAARLAQQGLVEAEQVNETVFLAELHRLRGLALGDERDRLTAARIAAEQGAELFEVRIAGRSPAASLW